MGRIWRHMPIHSIWRLSTILHMLGGDIGTIPCWVRASATAQWCHLQPSREPEFQKTSQFLLKLAWWWLHMPIHSHSIWSLSTTLHMLGGDMGTIPCWVWASAITQWCQLQASNYHIISEDFPNLGQLKWWWWAEYGAICPSTAYEACQPPLICWEKILQPFHVGLEPQPQHNCVICSPAENYNFRRLPNSYKKWPDDGFICPSTAYEGCQPRCICGRRYGNHSMLGLSLSHCTMVSIAGQQWTIISEDSQIWDNSIGGNGQNMAPYAHPQHMKLVNHLSSYVGRGYWNHSMLG